MPKHEIPYKMNVEVENSYGFGILTSGIDTKRYLKNSIVLKNHNANDPVGTAKDLSVKDKEAIVVIVIDDDDDDALKKLVRDIGKNLWNGLSMGLDPDFNSVQFGVEGFAPETPVFMKSELLELSVTPLPSNEDCLRLTHKGKLLSKEDVAVKLSAFTNLNLNKNPMNKLLLALIASLRLSADTSEDQAISKLSGVANDLSELEKLRAEKVEWLKKEGDIKLSRCSDLIDGAVTAKKILPAQKEDWTKLAPADYDSTKRTIDALPVHKTLGAQVTGEAEQEEDEFKNFKWDDFHKKAPKQLAVIKEKDPERYKKLFNAKFVKA